MMTAQERIPFTKPLTGGEKRELQVEIDRVLREMGLCDRSPRGPLELDFEKEVETAMEEFRRRSPLKFADISGATS